MPTIEEKAQILDILGYSYGDIANYCILNDLDSFEDVILAIFYIAKMGVK